MSTVARRRPMPRGRGRERPCPSPTLFDGVGGEPTLDAVLSRAWEGLAAHTSIACPLCGGAMTPEYGVHALPIGGRCGSCDTVLS